MKSRMLAPALLVALFACSDAATTVSPEFQQLAAANAAARLATVKIMDACDPTTFAVVPGGCQRNGGITLDQFTRQLTQLGTVPSWRFNPADLFLREGDSFVATNVGGENHTFTEVEEFGGGIVPNLNQLSGLTDVAPECAAFTPAMLIAPGQSSDVDETDEVGDEHYQCCIHPWMQMTVHVRER